LVLVEYRHNAIYHCTQKQILSVNSYTYADEIYLQQSQIQPKHDLCLQLYDV
jgi:hypothetical protein